MKGEGDLDDNQSMAKANRIHVFGAALREGLARLVDVGVNEIVVFPEDTDWGLVGADLRDAMESEKTECTVKDSTIDHEELVEA